MFNGPAIGLVFGVMVSLLGGMLVFSFRDTLQDIREFFQPITAKALRQFSLKRFVIAATILPPVIACAITCYMAGELGNLIVIALPFGYLLVVLLPLVYYFVTDAFGPLPGKRLRNYRHRTKL